MDYNNKFISKWKPIHEKAMVKYVIIGPLISLLIVSITTSIFITLFPRSQTKISYLIMTMGLLFLMFIMSRTLSWFSGEKRYRKIMDTELSQ